MLKKVKRLLLSGLKVAATAYAKCNVGSYGIGFTVNFPCQFTPSTHVGDHCHFNGIRVRGEGELRIGDYFHSGEDILVITWNHNYKAPDRLPYDENYVRRNVTIGRYVWVGSRSIILPGAELGDGCVVQAGAVVSGAHAPNSIIAGNPAIPIAYRDAELVEKLVSEGRFLT